jgi:hypothetical protein
MTAAQRAEKLFSLPALGGHRPSDLLVAMYEYCPAGEETSELFKALFLTRLPEIRVLLEPGEFAGLKQLATKADQLWLTFAAKQLATAAVVQQDSLQADEDVEPVAAIGGRRFKGKQKAKAAQEPASQTAPAQQASSGGGAGSKKSVSMVICWKHAKFGSKAFSCADAGACQWPEN